MDSVASFRFLKSMHSRHVWSGFRTRCTWLYSDAVDFSITPKVSNSAICFRKSASLSLVRKRGESRFRLSFHLSKSTVIDRGGTLAGSCLTVGENMSMMYSLHSSRMLRCRSAEPVMFICIRVSSMSTVLVLTSQRKGTRSDISTRSCPLWSAGAVGESEVLDYRSVGLVDRI